MIISGCGHPGIEAMLNRADQLFDAPVVGVVGGLHYTNQKLDTLQDDLQVLRDRRLKLLAISPHDTSPETIQIIQTALPGIVQTVEVGRQITLRK